jgi:hypothetical protein
MTDSTEVNLVSASSPAAGVGVAAGAAVNLTVSLGDRHSRVPFQVMPGGTTAMNVTAPAGSFYWLLPDGSTVAGTSGASFTGYTCPQGTACGTVYLVMNTGYTVAHITNMQVSSLKVKVNLEDFQHFRIPAGAQMWLYSGHVFGDIASLNSAMAAGASLYLDCAYSYSGITGDFTNLPALTVYNMYYWNNAIGVLTPHADCTIIRMLTGNACSYAQVSQTLVNWNAANAGTFTRTGVFNFYHFAQLTAEGQSAVTALRAKGATITLASG